MIGNKPDNGAMLALTTAGVEHIYALGNWKNWDLLRFFEESALFRPRW